MQHISVSVIEGLKIEQLLALRGIWTEEEGNMVLAKDKTTATEKTQQDVSTRNVLAGAAAAEGDADATLRPTSTKRWMEGDVPPTTEGKKQHSA